jgi:hypothetical protein
LHLSAIFFYSRGEKIDARRVWEIRSGEGKSEGVRGKRERKRAGERETELKRERERVK